MLFSSFFLPNSLRYCNNMWCWHRRYQKYLSRMNSKNEFLNLCGYNQQQWAYSSTNKILNLWITHYKYCPNSWTRAHPGYTVHIITVSRQNTENSNSQSQQFSRWIQQTVVTRRRCDACKVVTYTAYYMYSISQWLNINLQTNLSLRQQCLHKYLNWRKFTTTVQMH